MPKPVRTMQKATQQRGIEMIRNPISRATPPHYSPAWAAPIDDAAAANVQGDYADEVRIIRPLAAEGYASAQFFLGLSYLLGKGVPKNDAEAVKWFRLAAAQGFATAQITLGDIYYKGQGVVRDYAEAGKWYRLAAAQGDAQAQSNLGVMYNKGEGVLQDYAEAMKW